MDERQELLIKKVKHELKAAIAEIELENLELREENERLQSELRRDSSVLAMVGVAYYLIESDGSKIGPICPVCYERDGIPSILRSTDDGAECASCGREYPGVQASVRSRYCEIG